MGISLDVSTIGDVDDLQAGGERAAPGHGMILITEFEEYGGLNGKAHKLVFEIVAWTDSDSVGVSNTENIFHEDTYNDGSPFKKMAALGVATGLFTAEDIAGWKAAGEMPEIDYSNVVGRCAMTQLEEKPNKDATKKPYINVGMYGKAFFHMGDPRVADWPKNQSVLNAHGSKSGTFKMFGDAKPVAAKPAAGKDPFAAVKNA
jgi:hypothetical protein